MALPFLAAAIATYPVFLILFHGRDYIPRSIEVQGEESAIEPSSVLVDKWGAIFGSALLAVTLGVLVGTSVLGIPVWQVTVPPAVIMFIRDIVYDWHTSRPTPQPDTIEMEQKTVTSQMGVTEGVPPPPVIQNVQGFWNHLTPSYITSRFPTATTVLKRLPVALVPFALLTFVLVQGLTKKGWVELFANGWAWWARHTGVVGVTAGMGIIVCILCNVSNLRLLLTPRLTIGQDMWDEHRGNYLHRSSPGSLDRPDGGFPRSETTRRGNLHPRTRVELWGVLAHRMRFVGWAALEKHLETERGPRQPMAVLQTQPPFGRRFDGCIICRYHWGDVCGSQELDIRLCFCLECIIDRSLPYTNHICEQMNLSDALHLFTRVERVES